MKFTLRLIILILLFLLVYILAASYYYYTRYYNFNPYTQMNCPNYDDFEQNDEIIILCLGGSTTNDGRLAENEKYPSILERKLNEHFQGTEVKVLNGGMDWYTTKHSLINYSTYYKKFKPDIVIVMHAINDICRSFSPIEFSLGEYKDDYSHFHGPATNAANPPSFENYYARQILGDYKYQTLRWDLSPVPIDISSFKSINSYRNFYGTLINIILNDSAKCIMVEQPFLYEANMPEENKNLLWFGRSLCNNFGNEYPDYSSMYSAMKLFNNSADSISNYYKVPYVYTESKIPKNKLYYKDDVHHTAKMTDSLVNLILPTVISEIQLLKLTGTDK